MGWGGATCTMMNAAQSGPSWLIWKNGTILSGWFLAPQESVINQKPCSSNISPLNLSEVFSRSSHSKFLGLCQSGEGTKGGQQRQRHANYLTVGSLQANFCN